MEDAAVLEKLLAMIRGHDDQRVFELFRRAQVLDQSSQLRVRLADARGVQIDEVLDIAGVDIERLPAELQ